MVYMMMNSGAGGEAGVEGEGEAPHTGEQGCDVVQIYQPYP